MYGETHGRHPGVELLPGLSPHVRGNRDTPSHVGQVDGSIPACTGKPWAIPTLPRPSRVYPRMYGETPPSYCNTNPTSGLSPHVRGNPILPLWSRDAGGSIPACTGKPGGDHHLGDRPGVYPRMYGETSSDAQITRNRGGLSPHVRGNPVTPPTSPGDAGSIPACTGKPAAVVGSAAGSRVYPRMYGETYTSPPSVNDTEGLSPHVRGNPGRGRHGAGCSGSIPACTGKPRPGEPGERSIPACTGKPLKALESRFNCRVYPRMYGETPQLVIPCAYHDGLSPHVPRRSHAKEGLDLRELS